MPTPISPTWIRADWWLYQIYYNSGDGITNTVYQIDNVRAVNVTATVDYTGMFNPNDKANPPAGFNTSYTYSPAAIIDESIDETMATCTTGVARERKVNTFVTGTIVPATALNVMQDNQLWVKADDPTLWLHVTQLPRAFATTLNTGRRRYPHRPVLQLSGCRDTRDRPACAGG